jgi:PAS domain S-box-containing protein
MGEESNTDHTASIETEAQRLFRAVFEHTFHFMGILSPDGVLIDANRTALNFVGLQLSDVVGQLFWETPWWTRNPKSQIRVREAIAEATGGSVVRFDVEHTDPHGNVIVVDFSLTPVLDDNGRVKYLIPEGRDITDRVNAVRNLAEREARTRAIVDTAPDGIATITMGGIIESANAPMHKLFKYANGELIGKPVSEILEFFFGEDTYVQDSLKTGERKLFGVGRETIGIKRDGRKFPVEVALSLLNLGHNRIFVSVIRDITERKKSQQLQAQLAAIVEGSGDAIVGIDVDGIIASWNPAAELLYGYTVNEAIGRPVRIVVPREMRSEMDEMFARLLNGEPVGHFETVLQSKFGKLLEVDLTMSPIRNSQGQVVGISTIARDISLRKEADRRIGEFYSTVSHELRTPLTSIRASLGLLEGGVAGEIDEEALQLVEIARSESDRLIRLINDILDLRKIESGKLELKLRNIHLADMIASVLESITPMADEHKVKITTDCDAERYINLDRDRIIQVLANLISNAIKFSPRGETVTVTVAPSDDKSAMRFSITDKGAGIRPDQMHRLFGKFQQLDSSDTRAKGGTGLGLAICKAILEQHGGSIGVESEPGKGSTFWFELPNVEDLSEPPSSGDRLNEDRQASQFAHSTQTTQPIHSTAYDQKQPGQESDATYSNQSGPNTQANTLYTEANANQDLPPPKTGPVQVVIIEDDPSTLDLLSRQLEPLGIHCFGAVDGKTALVLVREKQPDLIILDVGIPAPDGFELVRILRQEKSAVIPLLVYTSLDLNESDRMRLTLGESRHLVKSRTSHEEFIDSVIHLINSGAKQHNAEPRIKDGSRLRTRTSGEHRMRTSGEQRWRIHSEQPKPEGDSK